MIWQAFAIEIVKCDLNAIRFNEMIIGVRREVTSRIYFLIRFWSDHNYCDKGYG